MISFKPFACSKREAAASAWIARREGGLTELEKTEFEQWLANPENAHAFARHLRAWTIPDGSLAAGGGPAMARMVRARAARRRRRISAGAGAAVLLAVGLWFLNFSREQAGPLPIAPNAVVVLPKKISLPDGSIVELKAGAEISTDFQGNYRRVALSKGEALFHVAKDKDHPFVVAAGRVEVQAVGTAFLVQIRNTAIEVVVTEGRVAVGEPSSPPTAGPLPPRLAPRLSGAHGATLVDAGNRLTVDLEGDPAAEARPQPVSGSELAALMAWRSPRIEFSGTPLAEAVALMNRYSHVRIMVGDSALAKLQVSGYFRADNSVAFLRLIEQGLDLHAEPAGDVIVLRKAR